mmetsp:Transcript_25637/g.42868  ORF Transcript_25637/g.42868 Transcript_25637/m.42868 type:complete len:334 (+) Transcript_25637:702-1703(+)
MPSKICTNFRLRLYVFFLYHHFLNHVYGPQERGFHVLHVDAKDVIFQTDIFAHPYLDYSKDMLYVFLETNNQRPWHTFERSHSFSKEFSALLRSFPDWEKRFKATPPQISCSGTILGSVEASKVHFGNIIKLALRLLNVNRKQFRRPWTPGCADQSLHVLALETQNIEKQNITIRRFTSFDGIIGTLGFWGCRNPVDNFSRLVDGHGYPLAVLHQYHFFSQEICEQLKYWPWYEQPLITNQSVSNTRVSTSNCQEEGNSLIVTTENVDFRNDELESKALSPFHQNHLNSLTSTFTTHLNEHHLGDSSFSCLSGSNKCAETVCLPCKQHEMTPT